MSLDYKGKNVRLTGAADLDRVLRQMPKHVAKKALNNAVLAGAGIIRKAALAKLGIGDRRAIATRNIRSSQYSVTRHIGPPKDRFYLMFREFGTRPHLISVRRRSGNKTLADKANNMTFGPVVEHPGQPARPFLRPAFDENHRKALDKIGERLGANIEKAAAKLAGSFSDSGLKRKRRRR